MDLIQHAIDLLGVGKTLPSWRFKCHLHNGAPVTVVDWRGCMATDRHVLHTGHVVRIANQREKFGTRADSIECLVIRKPDGSEDWQPLERTRLIGTERRVEIWL